MSDPVASANQTPSLVSTALDVEGAMDSTVAFPDGLPDMSISYSADAALLDTPIDRRKTGIR